MSTLKWSCAVCPIDLLRNLGFVAFLDAEINAKTQSRQDAKKIENTPKNFASLCLCVFALIPVGYARRGSYVSS